MCAAWGWTRPASWPPRLSGRACSSPGSWICTGAGTPGTWTQVSGGSGAAIADAYAPPTNVPTGTWILPLGRRSNANLLLTNGRMILGCSLGLEAGCAVFRFIDLAAAEPVQQRAHDAPHVRVVVDHEEAQPVEIDADHKRAKALPGRTGRRIKSVRRGH